MPVSFGGIADQAQSRLQFRRKMGSPAPFGNPIEQRDPLLQMSVRLTIRCHPKGASAGK
jgi:hypothetical protein